MFQEILNYPRKKIKEFDQHINAYALLESEQLDYNYLP